MLRAKTDTALEAREARAACCRREPFAQIWVPSWENRDLRQLLWHRHRMVQARTRIMNQLQAVALNEGLRVGSVLCPIKINLNLDELALLVLITLVRQ